jgi:hypothetical protein
MFAFVSGQLYLAGRLWLPEKRNDKMKRPKTIKLGALLIIAIGILFPCRSLFAQTDEIQVYDAAIAEVGTFNLTWHNNFTPDGQKEPAFPGAIIADKSFNGVTEWAYGVAPWFEAGLYLPLYSFTDQYGATFNGGKIRMLFVRPHAASHKFFYGANFEFSYNSDHWDARRFTSEIRPIIGVHLHPAGLHQIDLIVNPILDNSWAGGFKSLDFAPEARAAYDFSDKWAAAVEEYSDIGPLRDLYAVGRESQELWGVMDHAAGSVAIEAGIGFGLTSASDKVTLKLILSRDLHSKAKPQN